MSLAEENLRTLSRHHPEAFARIGDTAGRGTAGPSLGGAVASRVRILDTSSGVPTATVNGLLYHSRYDPRRDAALAAERDIDPSSTAIVVLGFGLGYGAEAARKRFPRLPLLVVEPDVELFRSALECRDLSGFLAEPGVTLHVGQPSEALPRVLESLPLARPGFLRLRPAFQANPLPYRAAEEVLQSWLLRSDINTNTLARFGRLWVRNLCRNMRAFADNPGVGVLSGLFDGIPALVLAGGPSLDALMPHLPRLRERLLLIAVNTPLRPCVEAGVEPDFTVVVDPQFWASRYLDWTATKDGCMVAEPSTCPRVLRRDGAAFFLCSSLFPLGETLEKATGARGKLGAGGSVATSAWDLARLLGCRPLYAAGLDLGFPQMRTHCRGVFVEDAWLAASTRLAPVEGSSWRSLRDIGLFAVRASGGGVTPTDRRMLLYKWWFENQLSMPGAVECYTLSPGGAAIEGMPLANERQLLGLPPIRPAIDLRVARARSLHERGPATRQSAASLRAGLEAVHAGLTELEALAAEGREKSALLGETLRRGGNPAPLLRALDGVDHRILGLSARTIAGFLIQSLIHRIAGEGENDTDPRAVTARSAEMYEGIGESAGWQRRLIRRAADSLRDEELFP